MKLLMTTDTVGGVWQYALSLCGALQAAGVEIVLASMGRALSPAQRAAAAELDNVMMAEGRFRLEWMQDAEHDVADSGIWLLALAERHDVDLVHVNGYAHAALPFGRPVVAVAHSDVVSWFAAVKGDSTPAAWEHYRRAVELGLSHADAVVAPTEAVARDLARSFGFAANWTRVIPNGIALAHYAPAPKRPFILSAGRLWDEAKNIEQLDRIAPQIAWPIEIAGEGQHPDGGGKKSGRGHAARRSDLHRDERAAGRRRNLCRAGSLRAIRPRDPRGGGERMRAGAGGHPLALGELARRGDFHSAR